LINILKNAVESHQGKVGTIQIEVGSNSKFLILTIRDQGIGISNPENLFTPLYTTKERGSGVGLTLCRQILALHGGDISLRNRANKQGAEATIRLPVAGETPQGRIGGSRWKQTLAPSTGGDTL
jgi:signal transduction histidine kinase